MSGHANLSEYLGKVLVTLAGYWLRAGDRVSNPGVLFDPGPRIAGTTGPFPAWGFGERFRMKGFTNTAAGLPTAHLADEILEPGEGQVRALIVVGGNPMLAFPNQLKVFEAMKSLELLVCIDPHMSATAKLADYVIAPPLPLEGENTSLLTEWFGAFSGSPGAGYTIPYAQYQAPILERPAGSDLLEEWEFAFGICQRLGKQLTIKPFGGFGAGAAEAGTRLDMTTPPTSEETWELITKGAPVSFKELKALGPGPHVFDRPETFVQARPEGWEGRLDVGSAPMLAELAEVALEDFSRRDDAFAFRLINRRVTRSMNSSWHEHDGLHHPRPFNPSFMNPADLAQLDLESGDLIEIASATATVLAVAKAAPDVRSGCISMNHCWGANPDEDANVFSVGTSTAILVSTDDGYDPYTGIPVMSGIPVNVRKPAVGAAAALQ
jgi:anaerobic selenocysteine-containing dehydrogenase